MNWLMKSNQDLSFISPIMLDDRYLVREILTVIIYSPYSIITTFFYSQGDAWFTVTNSQELPKRQDAGVSTTLPFDLILFNEVVPSGTQIYVSYYHVIIVYINIKVLIVANFCIFVLYYHKQCIL